MARQPSKKRQATNGVTHLTEPVEFDEEGGIFYCTTRSGGAETILSQTPHNLLVGIERATVAYNAWAASHREAQAIKSKPPRVRLHKEDD